LLLSRNVLHPHNDLAAEFIFQTLNRFGLPTYNQIYSITGRNVYSIKTGTDYPNQKFIICAHYDDSPVQPPAPGADDNGSGTAAVLEAARILSQVSTPYTIIFALWVEEEIGHFGSAYFAQQAYLSGEDILGVINLEMFGWDSNDDGLIDIHTRPIAYSVELANLIYYLENHYNLGLSSVIYNPGTNASDHASFWNYGYSALVFGEAFYGGDFNPFYQTTNDLIGHFNLDYYHALSKLAISTIAHLAFYNLSTGLEKLKNISISGFNLYQNYPNPFNPITTIEFDLPKTGEVTIKIFNILGQEVATLVMEKLAAGSYKYIFDASGLVSGVYLYRLETDKFVQIRKMVLMR
jgi:Zn-dependent M28 family amino/carboxypeptidase